MESTALIDMTPEDITYLVDFLRKQARYSARNDNYFISKLPTYEVSKIPYPNDKERHIYEELAATNRNYSLENIVNQEYLINGNRNQLLDRMFIDIINKIVNEGVYDDNIENDLSDYIKFILYIDTYIRRQGTEPVLTEALTNALINRASKLIREGHYVVTNQSYDVYEMMPDELNCKGIDPISSQPIKTGFRLDADERRICYDISTIVAIANSTFGIQTPVSPFTRRPFSENDMKRIRGFIRNMETSRPVTRSMTRRAVGGKTKKYGRLLKIKGNKKYRKTKNNKKIYRKSKSRR
jgi:hypothetical protein